MIPDCFERVIHVDDTDEVHSNLMWLSFFIFAGFTLFLLIEKILILTGISHHHDILEH